MELTSAQRNALVQTLAEYFPLKSDVNRAFVDVEKRIQSRAANRKSDFSITTWIRGLIASQRGPSLPNTDPAADLRYFEANKVVSRDLSTSATPGSFLVPTMQASEIIAMLADYGALRRAGCREIPMSGLQKLTIPVALTAPTTEWLGQNTQQSASDADLGQLSFDLKTSRSLSNVPNELLASSVPAIDALLSEVMAKGIAEAEDEAFFATSSVSNGPASLYSDIANLTSLKANANNVSGGALGYRDILATLGAARGAKAKGPFCWFSSPETLYSKVSGLLDLNSRPIFDPNAIVQRLFGWPVIDTTWIKADQSNASGSSQTYIVLANPSNIFIASPGGIELATSFEFAFDKNVTTLRAVNRVDFGWAPKKAITILRAID